MLKVYNSTVGYHNTVIEKNQSYNFATYKFSKRGGSPKRKYVKCQRPGERGVFSVYDESCTMKVADASQCSTL